MKALIFLLTANVVFAANMAVAADAQRLNVLFITADDLGLQLSCYGETRIATPNLDRLAASGVRFEVAYVTSATCSSSRSSMLTGLYPHTNGQIGLTAAGFRLTEPVQRITIPALLKGGAGYRTGIIGKLHVAPEEAFPFDFRKLRPIETRTVRDVAQQATEFLADESDQPFFLMVNYSDPHATRAAPGSRDWYFPNQIAGLPEDPIEPSAETVWPFQQIDTPEQRVRVAGYYNSVKRLDAGVGMLLKALDDSGHGEDTLVIFLGDHGPPFARGKTTCYESGLRVPFMIRWPGVSRPMVSSAMVSAVDIVPTILDATGLEAPAGLQGRSLRPVIVDRDAPWREYLFAEHHFHGWRPFYPRRAVRDQRYKLIHNLLAGKAKPWTHIAGDEAYQISRGAAYDGTPARQAFDTFADPPEFELYDLEDDPNEFENLAAKPEFLETRNRMRSALDKWRRDTFDPFLNPEELVKWANRVREIDESSESVEPIE